MFRPRGRRETTLLVVGCALALSLALISPAFAGTRDAGISQPNVPHSVSSGRLFTVTGFGDKQAGTGPVRLVFYQRIRGSWVLIKTQSAYWSGWTSETSKYLADVTLPYVGEWRIGASYGGNSVYASDYTFRDIYVSSSPALGLPRPNVPSQILPGEQFTVTSSYVSKDAETGRIRLIFYQWIRGTWVLQKKVDAAWSGDWPYAENRTVMYRGETSLPYVGTWRVGAVYMGNDIYPSEYAYRDFPVSAP